MIEASARLSKIVSKHATSHSAASSVNASAAVDIGLPISANANALLDPSNVLLNQSNALLNLANALRRNGSHRLNEMDDDTYKYRVEEDKYRVSNEMEYINSQTVRDSDSAHTIPHLNTTLDRGQINIMNAYRSNNSNNNNNNNKYPFSSDTLTSTSTSSKKKTSDIPSSVGILNQHSHHIARLSMKRVHDDVNNNSSNSQNQHHNHHMSHLNQVHRDSYQSSVDFTPNNSNSQLCSVIPRSNSHFARSHYGIVPTPSLSSTSTSSSASSTQSYTVIRSQGVNPALLYPHHQGDVSGINLFRVCSSTNTNASTKTNINSNINASPNVDVRLLHLLSGDQICTENYINSNSSYLPPKIINSNPLFTIPKTGSSTTGVNQGSVDSVFVEKKR